MQFVYVRPDAMMLLLYATNLTWMTSHCLPFYAVYGLNEIYILNCCFIEFGIIWLKTVTKF